MANENNNTLTPKQWLTQNLTSVLSELWDSIVSVFATKQEVADALAEGGGTDRSVTAPEYHYAPQADGNAQLTATREGSASPYAGNTECEVLTGLKVQRDAKGHITGVTYTSQKVKDTNTSYSAGTAALLDAGTNTSTRVWPAKTLADYVKVQVDDAVLYPVDIATLTPQSTFRKNAVLGINGVLYRAIRATGNMPVTPQTDNGQFVTNTINGKVALVIADFTLNSDWEVFTDASIEYWVAGINASLSAKQDAITDLSAIRTKANSALQPDTTYTYQNQSYTIDAMMQELVKFMSKTIVTNN